MTGILKRWAGVFSVTFATSLATIVAGCAGSQRTDRVVTTADCPRGGEASQFEIREGRRKLHVRVTARDYAQAKAIQEEAEMLGRYLLLAQFRGVETSEEALVQRLSIDAHPRGVELSFLVNETEDMQALRARTEEQVREWSQDACPIGAAPVASR